MAAGPAVIEWLLPQPVPCQFEFACLPVPQRQGEHAGSPPQGLCEAPARNSRQQRLGIRMATPLRRSACSGKFVPQIKMIIDFAVEHENEAAAIRDHRLVTGKRPVDDGQTPVPKRDPGLRIGPCAEIIRASMRNRVGHLSHGAFKMFLMSETAC